MHRGVAVMDYGEEGMCEDRSEYFFCLILAVVLEIGPPH